MISGSGVLMRLDSIWRQVARNSEDLPHTETLFLSPGLLPLLGYTQGSLFCSRRSRKTSSIFTFSPFHLFQPFKMSWRHWSDVDFFLIETWLSVTAGLTGDTGLEKLGVVGSLYIRQEMDVIGCDSPSILPRSYTHTLSPPHTLHPEAAELD